MIKIKFERYWNDFTRKNEVQSFSSLDALADWMFGQMQRDYTKDFAMSFPTPEKAKRIGETGPWRIEFQPQFGGESIWIYLIENSSGIIFSDGRFTSGQKHWSAEVQQWLAACEERRRGPKFNFVDEKPPAPAEPQWFATTRWCAEDVMGVAEERGIPMTEEQAIAWWKRNESRFLDLLVGRGHGILFDTDFDE